MVAHLLSLPFTCSEDSPSLTLSELAGTHWGETVMADVATELVASNILEDAP